MVSCFYHNGIILFPLKIPVSHMTVRLRTEPDCYLIEFNYWFRLMRDNCPDVKLSNILTRSKQEKIQSKTEFKCYSK